MAQQNQNTKLLKNLADKQLEQASDISILTNKVDDLEKGIQRILFLIDDDKNTGSKGAIGRIMACEKRTDKLENFKTDFTARFSVIAIIITIISTFILNLLKELFVK